MAKQTIKLGDNSTELDSLNEEEVKGIVDASLDEKLSALDLPASIDVDSLKKDILGEMESKFTELFDKNKLDEEALVKKLDKSFGDVLGKALKGVGNGGSKEKTPGALTRFLSS